MTFVTSNRSDRSKLQAGFNRALEAIFSPKNSENYLQWKRDVDAYKLSQLSDKYRNTDLAKCRYYLEAALALIPNNQNLETKLQQIQIINA
jgi:hypothetical protein